MEEMKSVTWWEEALAAAEDADAQADALRGLVDAYDRGESSEALLRVLAMLFLAAGIIACGYWIWVATDTRYAGVLPKDFQDAAKRAAGVWSVIALLSGIVSAYLCKKFADLVDLAKAANARLRLGLLRG